MQKSRLIILTIVIIGIVLLNPPKLTASAEELSMEEIEMFLQEAFDAQLLLNSKSRTKDEVMAVLSPYFTEDYSKMFMEARLFKDLYGWYLPGSDDFYAIVPRFSFDGSTKITQTSNKILITEFVEANTEGPWTWDAHVESLEIQLTSDGWRIRNINEILETTSEISIVLQGESLTLVQPPINHSNRVLIPLRGVFEHMGAKVTWTGAEKKVEIKKDEDWITLTIGSKVADVNEKSITMDTVPIVIDGHTMVPIRFISESLGMRVSWDSAIQTVFIE